MNCKPRYFFVAFGLEHSSKHPVDGGIYPHIDGYVTNSGITKGDVMMLYFCGNYPGYDREVPGIGIVTSVENEGNRKVIYYQYLPLCNTITLKQAKVAIPELRNKTNFGWKSNWLRNIDSFSFRNAIAGRQIDWP